MIVLNHVSMCYEDNSAVLQDISLTIEEGEFLLLTGPNGSGKTTLFRLLLKEMEPTQGEIVVNGKKLSELKHHEIPYYRRGLGIVFQNFCLLEEKTVYENLELACVVTGTGRRTAVRRIGAILSMLGIQRLHRHYPRQLSGGEKQKVCLARALINYPSILLADEPTANLDPQASREIMQLFRLVQEQGITVIVATHDVESSTGLYTREISLD